MTATQTPSHPEIRAVPVDDLIPYARNARTHSESQVAQIAASIREFGWTNPILIAPDRGIIAGHGRVLAARMLGLSAVPAIELAHLTEQQRRAYVIADNRLAELAGWDDGLLALELGELRSAGLDLEMVGYSDSELDRLLASLGTPAPDGGEPIVAQRLADRFLIPPFSVLNAREGWWQDRKRAWIALGIKSECGRGANLLKNSLHVRIAHARSGTPYSEVVAYIDACRAKGMSDDDILADCGGPAAGDSGAARAFAKGSRRTDNLDPVTARTLAQNGAGGTSIFDPVLCEIAYRWFCPPGGVILDPFAGGSVRGVVAAKLGLDYTGCDLRAEQVAANREQGAELLIDAPGSAEWVEGDSRETVPGLDIAADLIFTCPPYGDLERYSDDPGDLSAMEWADFARAYREIIAAACAKLHKDRFAVIVVGEFRDQKTGIYRGLVPATIAAFEKAGLRYYNEAILVTAIGTLPLRAAGGFSASRKLGKTHQNVLVFVKGDARRAAAACGTVDLSDALEGVEATDDGGGDAGGTITL